MLTLLNRHQQADQAGNRWIGIEVPQGDTNTKLFTDGGQKLNSAQRISTCGEKITIFTVTLLSKDHIPDILHLIVNTVTLHLSLGYSVVIVEFALCYPVSYTHLTLPTILLV